MHSLSTEDWWNFMPQYRRKSDGACVRAELQGKEYALVFHDTHRYWKQIPHALFKRQYEPLTEFLARGRFPEYRKRKPYVSKFRDGGGFADVCDLCRWILVAKPVYVSGRINNWAFMQNQSLETLRRIARTARKAIPVNRCEAQGI